MKIDIPYDIGDTMVIILTAVHSDILTSEILKMFSKQEKKPKPHLIS